MSVAFEWRFEDERPSDQPPGEDGRDRRRARWPLWLSLGLVVLAGVGLIAWWRVRSEALAQVEAEVQAVAQLELRALAEGDTELYLGLQDEADPNWWEAQEARAEAGVLLPPPLPNLTATTTITVEKARVVGDGARVEVVQMVGLPGADDDPRRPLAEAEIDLLLAFIEEEYGRSQVAGLLHASRTAPQIGALMWEALEEDRPAFESRYVAYVRERAGR